MLKIKLSPDCDAKGPRIHVLFYREGVQFHIRKVEKVFEITRLLDSRPTHIMRVDDDQLDTIMVQPIINTLPKVWELDIEGGNIVDVLNTVQVFNNPLPMYSDVMPSTRKVSGEPMNEEEILKLVS